MLRVTKKKRKRRYVQTKHKSVQTVFVVSRSRIRYSHSRRKRTFAGILPTSPLRNWFRARNGLVQTQPISVDGCRPSPFKYKYVQNLPEFFSFPERKIRSAAQRNPFKIQIRHSNTSLKNTVDVFFKKKQFDCLQVGKATGSFPCKKGPLDEEKSRVVIGAELRQQKARNWAWFTGRSLRHSGRTIGGEYAAGLIGISPNISLKSCLE